MNILIFGATGMVGQGVLRECLLAPDVERVVAVGRNATGQQHPKLEDLVVKDMYDYSAVESQLQGFDACFFCLGVSSVGMKEDDYRRVTYDLTMAAATVLARLNPGMTFTYVTGSGTDSSERGSSMWARVKGATENALLRLPFKAAYMFRPGIIQPLHGVRSKTPLYHSVYMVISPLLSLAYRLWPDKMTTSEQIGLAMLAVARSGAPKVLLDPTDINALR
ncbi:NAD-dependent epimerase/dehydratase family protein [Variovorax sp. ZS18.2.2]|uniref:NAD-dependent epimerase/dehydratase family protein n=1 Tax=Variovorax sp. ZS18.2.2 TaxID=2971255 RepID=UPI0021507ECF|nr:NAD-dependent epimerase/dehydratase family protein [Variovorax sp. ZS18.2.2]MCR6474770.1 NAD-dependent epimerase/dehydratase family protein [Variovorax sp. ZS18.2.2]